jgi:hypothetical protein
MNGLLPKGPLPLNGLPIWPMPAPLFPILPAPVGQLKISEGHSYYKLNPIKMENLKHSYVVQIVRHKGRKKIALFDVLTRQYFSHDGKLLINVKEA